MNNLYYNCTDCPSLIEILSINKNTNIIRFKCLNEDNNNIKEMPIKEYLVKMKKYKNKEINNDKCDIHNTNNSKYINYCLNCNQHLCNECLVTRKHINHNKNNVVEIQPTDEELHKMNNIIKDYQNKIEYLNQLKINRPKELKDLIFKRKIQINKKVKEILNQNKINEQNELKLYNDIYLLDIEEIKKRYENEIIERKNRLKEDENEIIKKYKLINEKERVNHKYKINEMNKLYARKIKTLDTKIENMTNLKKINELIYNTYYMYNNNYYNAINLRNALLSYENPNRNIDNKNDNINNFNDNIHNNNNILIKDNIKQNKEEYKNDIHDNNIYRKDNVEQNKEEDKGNNDINELIYNYQCWNCCISPIICKMYYCDKCNIYLCEECGKKLTPHHSHNFTLINSKLQLKEIKEKENKNDEMLAKEISKIETKNKNNENKNENKNENNEKNKDKDDNQKCCDNSYNDCNNECYKNNKLEIVQNIASNIVYKLKYGSKIKELRNIYNLDGISDNQLIEALKNANGNIEQAIILLFK